MRFKALIAAMPLLLAGCGGEGASSGPIGAITAAVTQMAVSVAGPVATSPKAPVIFNASGSARPWHVISVQGANFGTNPTVQLAWGTTTQTVRPVSRIGDWLAVAVPGTAAGAVRLSITTPSGTTTEVFNAARAFHFDALQVAPGGTFRIFGRNLKFDSFEPTVTVGGAAATVDTAASTERMLVVRAPASLRPGTTANVTIDNGNGSGSSTAERTVAVVNGSGDPFGLGVGWTGMFTALGSRKVDVACSGDISAAAQDAVNSVAAQGGGTVQIGAGTCTLSRGIGMRSDVVFSGAGRDATVLRYTGNYPFWAEGLQRVAVRNLTLQNGGVEEPALFKHNRSVVLQNVAFRLGRSRQMFLSENEDIAVVNCLFDQGEGVALQPPFLLDTGRGIVFQGNQTNLVVGSASFQRVSDAFINANIFQRDARQQNAPGTLHMMAIDFAERIAITANTFRTANGIITNRNRNDGESILTEGGGPNRTESIGTVASATATTIYDPRASLRTNPFGTGTLPANMGIAIVAGRGAGQTRGVTRVSSGTITVDEPWQLQPDSTSRYAAFVWGLQKAQIEDNVFLNMPRGIWLYQAAIRDVDLDGNMFRGSGGIYLRSFQDLSAGMFDPIYNVEATGNTVRNGNGGWAAHIAAIFVNRDARDYGIAMQGLRFIGNLVETSPNNLNLGTEEYAGSEGYFSMMRVENYSSYESGALPRILGTIFHGNTCVNCATDYRVGTGSAGTVISGAKRTNSKLLWENWRTTSSAELGTNTVVR